jgi:hypothetical protein
MTLYQLLKTSEHKTRIRIFFRGTYFDITDSTQMISFTKFIETYLTEEFEGEDEDWSPEVEKWNVQNITFTEWGKEGDRIETTERVLFIHLK